MAGTWKLNCRRIMGDSWRWEDDPLFFAAEQVQDSTDALVRAFGAWKVEKAMREWDTHGSESIEALDHRRRQLATAFGVASGQLAEFQREVTYLHMSTDPCVDERVFCKYREFISAIDNQIASMRDDLRAVEDEVLPTAKCNSETEVDDLALFLLGAQVDGDYTLDASALSLNDSVPSNLVHEELVGGTTENLCTSRAARPEAVYYRASTCAEIRRDKSRGGFDVVQQSERCRNEKTINVPRAEPDYSSITIIDSFNSVYGEQKNAKLHSYGCSARGLLGSNPTEQVYDRCIKRIFFFSHKAFQLVARIRLSLLQLLRLSNFGLKSCKHRKTDK
ncbi:hypothetical protein KP509_38G027800 [Ceratopteris richardii]|uniref:Syntaxin 6 N-terminal domain-containing protein n=1 Tax=Ceratopteris richardii TaxID=49495 RepID=A0A8T2Q3D3_CERRI|nr:hypothetical protein KP509_38G027800 [Ceratopteris richardii]